MSPKKGYRLEPFDLLNLSYDNNGVTLYNKLVNLSINNTSVDIPDHRLGPGPSYDRFDICLTALVLGTLYGKEFRYLTGIRGQRNFFRYGSHSFVIIDEFLFRLLSKKKKKCRQEIGETILFQARNGCVTGASQLK